MSENQFKPIQSVIKNILTKYDLKENLNESSLIQNWENIVGKELANVCTPFKLENGELIVKVENKIWRDELALRQDDLLHLLALQFKESGINRITFI